MKAPCLLVSSMLLCVSAHAQNISFNATYTDTYDEVCGTDDTEEGCAEISAIDTVNSRLFTTNAFENQLRVTDVVVTGRLFDVGTIDLSSYGAAPNSVAVSDGVVAVAVESEEKTDVGQIVLFNTQSLELLAQIPAGSLPDMVAFTPDGAYLLVANEGEPSDEYLTDPVGSVTVVSMEDFSTRSAHFDALSILDDSVRVFGPGASVEQDLEPEYITVSSDSSTAWISLQENNAIAIMDIDSAAIIAVKGMGFKEHAVEGAEFDASNLDGGEACEIALEDPEQCIKIRNWPTFGMYQPDAIAAFDAEGTTYLISANEGDARDYDGYSEEARVGDDEYVLDPVAFPDAEELKDDANLGRLKTTLATGDTDGDGDFDRIYSYGARSFSIWDASGNLVFDSGADLEIRLSALQQSGVDVWTDSRSDDKGPEPESVTVGYLNGKLIGFVGLERTSGVFAYDLSVPQAPGYLGYIDIKAAGDVAPEGLVFKSTSDNSGILIVTSEVSNTISTYVITLSNGGSPGNLEPESQVVASAGRIDWSGSGYWQVQTINPYDTVCEGTLIRSCSVAPGTYNVINHTTGERFENIEVSAVAMSKPPVVDGNTISWQDAGYWQVQTIDPYESVCEGESIRDCEVAPGVYHVINLTTGERFENVEVTGDVSETVQIVGNTISWTGDGYWHVQTINPYVSVCEGSDIRSCEVEDGEYNLINHTTGTRFENLMVGNESQGVEDESFALKILHINDHHSHLEAEGTSLTLAGEETDVEIGGFPRVVSKMKELEQGTDSVLKLHAGDAITGTLFYTLFNGEADAALMSELCFDAFTLGNHEFDDGDAGLAEFLDYLAAGPCDTDVLAANVVPEVGVSPLAVNSATDYIQPFTIKTVNGQDIGVIGIDIALKTKNSSNPNVTTQFLDETTTAQQFIDELLAQGIDKIVLLTHYQYNSDVELAKALRGVDVIVGGDSHTLLGDGLLPYGLPVQGPYPTQLTNADGNPVCVVQA